MTDPYLGEIRTFAFNFAPSGWTTCDGQLLPIAQNQSLYSLLGTIYGGDGRTTFALPDLRGRASLHFGRGPGLAPVNQGQAGGTETVTLQVDHLPQHQHLVNATTAAADSDDASGRILATAQTGPNSGTEVPVYDPLTAQRQMRTDAITDTGGSQSHANMQPFLVINFCMALTGLYPPRN